MDHRARVGEGVVAIDRDAADLIGAQEHPDVLLDRFVEPVHVGLEVFGRGRFPRVVAAMEREVISPGDSDQDRDPAAAADVARGGGVGGLLGQRPVDPQDPGGHGRRRGGLDLHGDFQTRDRHLVEDSLLELLGAGRGRRLHGRRRIARIPIDQPPGDVRDRHLFRVDLADGPQEDLGDRINVPPREPAAVLGSDVHECLEFSLPA